MHAVRLPHNPILTPDTAGWSAEAVGRNFNGPSLIRVAEVLPDPLGRYYLYFAHHQGRSIRLAFADDLAGPWTIHPPGTLQLHQTRFNHHIASPDVHHDPDRGGLVMYYHGCCNTDPAIAWEQVTCVARSDDGLTWTSDPTPLCQSYLRAFTWRGRRYGIAMPGEFYRMTDGWAGLEPRPGRIAGRLAGVDESAVTDDLKPRHFAVRVVGDRLQLFFSRAGDAPERLLLSEIELTDDWSAWQPSPPREVLRPERDWEGADQPLTASRGGAIHQPARQLRDPAVFTEADGRTYLLYAAAGESALALAELVDD